MKKVLKIKDVAHTSGLSRSSIYRLMKLGMFPKPIRIGITAIGWLSSDIDQFLEERQQESLC